jgi:hypothetical protein
VAFLIEQVLETEVCLVHVMAGICGCEFVGARGMVCLAVESLEAGEQGLSADVEGEGVRRAVVVSDVAQGVEDGVCRRWGCDDHGHSVWRTLRRETRPGIGRSGGCLSAALLSG